MKLFHHPFRNFGDAPLNTWLWPRLLPGLLDDDGRVLFVGIGSLLGLRRIPVEPLKVVFGTGTGYQKSDRPLDPRCRVYCVRGPLTAQRFGLDPALAITDGAALVRVAGPPSPPVRHRAAFMPHWQSATYFDWRQLCGDIGVRYIDPTADAEAVLRDVAASEVVVAEAMHGAVVSDALRVPWIPVRGYAHILAFKWHDWCRSIDLRYAPAGLGPLPLYGPDKVEVKIRQRLERGGRAVVPSGIVRGITRAARIATAGLTGALAWQTARRLRRIVDEAPRMLSAQATLDRLTERLLARLEDVKADHAAGRLAPAAGAAASGAR